MKSKVAEVLVSFWLKPTICLMFASAAFSSCQEPCIEINVTPWVMTCIAVLEANGAGYVESGWKFEGGVQKNWITWESEYSVDMDTFRLRTINYFIGERNYSDTVHLVKGDSVLWEEAMILEHDRHDQLGYVEEGVAVRIYKR